MSGNSSDLPSLREVIESHGLLAKKSLGQNFLLNMDITRRIARASGRFEGVTVLEIGPGPGGLTRALLEAGAHVVAIERDHRCLEILSDLQAAFSKDDHSQLSIIAGDALKITPQSVVPEGAIKIVSNLPYNIGTLLLTQWLSDLDRITSMTLMFQKEVALRFVAKPCSKSYGRLSILSQWLCDVHRLFDLSPRAFVPATKVTSSVVQFVPKAMDPSERALIPVVSLITQHAFGQRRKMIRSSLKSLFSIDDLEAMKISPSARAEELTVSTYVQMARYLHKTNLADRPH